MSNPTTPFGWQMPTNTDLVTDLPADFEVFGQAVATSMQDLLGGTTGQLLSKASGTDMDFTWTTPNAGDITGVTAGTGITGGGTSGDVTVTNSMATAIDAKGDLIVGTGADAFSRLAVGTNGQVLTANSAAATGLEYTTITAGSMTLISTTTLTGSSITLSSIPQTYNDLIVVCQNFKPATDSARGRMQINADTATRYRTIQAFTSIQGTYNATFIDSVFSENDNSVATGLSIIEIPNYTNAITQKMVQSISLGNDATTTTEIQFNLVYGVYNQTAAITSLTFFLTTGNFTSGTLLLYGVK